MFQITCRHNSDDAATITAAVNQGIDARLEAFTASKFKHSDGRLVCNFDEAELQILVRRLLEAETPEAERWADDIVYVQWGHETV